MCAAPRECERARCCLRCPLGQPVPTSCGMEAPDGGLLPPLEPGPANSAKCQYMRLWHAVLRGKSRVRGEWDKWAALSQRLPHVLHISPKSPLPLPYLAAPCCVRVCAGVHQCSPVLAVSDCSTPVCLPDCPPRPPHGDPSDPPKACPDATTQEPPTTPAVP